MGCPDRPDRLAEPGLLPCPFCQGAPRPRPWGPVVAPTPLLEPCSLANGGGWHVTCYGCRVQTWHGLPRAEAIAAWNQRPDLTRFTARLDGLGATPHWGRIVDAAAVDVLLDACAALGGQAIVDAFWRWSLRMANAEMAPDERRSDFNTRSITP